MRVDFDLWPYPRLVAHRGAGRLAPENTLAAFRVGATCGYRMFEFDVKLSGDGVPFLLHDATLERTTSGAGVAGALTWSQLSALDAGGWHGAGFAGEPIPRLSSIERYLQANGFLADIEIKPSPGTDDETGRVVAAHCERSWHDAGTPPILTSFSEAALEAAAVQSPALPRGLLLDTLPGDWLDRIRRLDALALAANHRVLSAEIVAVAHAERIRVLCYTANEPARVALLLKWGVDCVITDAVDRISVESQA